MRKSCGIPHAIESVQEGCVADPVRSGQFAMLGADSEFPTEILSGGIFVPSRNFGCGSSHEFEKMQLNERYEE